MQDSQGEEEAANGLDHLAADQGNLFQEGELRFGEDDNEDEDGGEDRELEDYHDCGDDGDDDDDDAIDQLLAADSPHLDGTMRISPQERDWALAIKQAVEDHKDLKELTDMEYAHYAIICEGNLRNALKRISSMQDFREAYNVDNSVEQGFEMLAALMEQHPGYVLCIDVDSVTMEGLHVIDPGNCDPLIALSVDSTKGADHNWKVLVLGSYYLFYAVQPVLTTVRAGNYTIADFSAVSWTILNMEFQSRLAGELLSNYPIKFSKFLAFNTGFVTNICWSVLKKIYPPAITGVLQLGCRVPLVGDQEVPLKLEETYLQPSMKTAYERLLLRAKDLLSLRRKNEEFFRL